MDLLAYALAKKNTSAVIEETLNNSIKVGENGN